MADVEFINNAPEVLKNLDEAVLRALERIGLQAVGYAIDLCPVDTGNLRNSIDHKVDESDQTVYIGTPNEYGPYVELGTGMYYPGGRRDPWVYQDEKGNWHKTSGQKAQPYIKPAISDHTQTYKNIVKDEMGG